MTWASGYHAKRLFYSIDLLKHLKYAIDFEHGRGTISLEDINSKQRWYVL